MSRTYSVQASNAPVYEELRYKMVSVCPNCGDIAVGTIYSRDGSWDALSKVVRKTRPKCLVCRGRFLPKEEYSVFGWVKDCGTDLAMKKALSERIAQAEEDACRNAISKQESKVRVCKDKSEDNPFAQGVKGDIEKLKQYLQHLINVEFSALFLTEQLVVLNQNECERKRQICAGSAAAEAEEGKKRKALLQEIEKLKQKFDSKDWDTVEVTDVKRPPEPRFVAVPKATKPTAPILKTPNFFNKKRVLTENEQRQKEYEQALVVYEKITEQRRLALEKNDALRAQHAKDMKEYTARLEQAKAQARAKKLEEKQTAQVVLDQEIEKINRKLQALESATEVNVEEDEIFALLTEKTASCQDLLRKAWDAKQKVLSVNVLYPNYRDIFATTCFYEYFNSKRCYELEGPNGAYNLYESERRSDAFATFFRKLEDINKNQVVLYRTATEMYKNVKKYANACKKAIDAINENGDKKGKEAQKTLQDAVGNYSDISSKFREKIEQELQAALDFVG